MQEEVPARHPAAERVSIMTGAHTIRRLFARTSVPPWRRAVAALAAVLALALGTGPAGAQGTEESFDLEQELADWDREMAELDSRLSEMERSVAKEIESAADRKDWFDYVDALDFARFANGGLLPSFSEQMRRNEFFEGFDLQPILAQGQHFNHFCSNVYGATHTVPFGSYDGTGIVSVHEHRDEPPPLPFMHDRHFETPGGAWSFEPGGLLLRTVEIVDAFGNSVGEPPTTWVDCQTIIRYRYIGARGDITFTTRGIDPVCQFRENDTTDPTACGQRLFGGARYPAPCTRPTQYWSTNGQIALDVTDQNAPVLRFPDGSVEVMGSRRTDWLLLFSPLPARPFFAHHQSFFRSGFPGAFSVEAYWTTNHLLDRNGSRTRYEHDANGWVSGVVDPAGRRTGYTRDADGDVTAITQPGFGGALLTWTLTWQTFTWARPEDDFPEVECWNLNEVVACPQQTFKTLTRMELPDGRAYVFRYGGYGNLTEVEAPDGAVTAYGYGNRNTSFHIPPSWHNYDMFGSSNFDKHCPDKTRALLKRRLTSTTVFPEGRSGRALVTTTHHAGETVFAEKPVERRCWKVLWIHQTFPDGKVRKTGICAGNESRRSALDGRTFAEEVWDANGLKEASYYGNPGTIGDLSAPGFMFMAWENASGTTFPFFRGFHNYDARPTKVVRLRDGVKWTETFEYDTSDIPANATQLRTLGNVTATELRDANGTLRKRIETTYVRTPDYVSTMKNLIRLPQTTVLKSGSGTRLSRTDQAYDQFALTATGAPNLVAVGPFRGNPTTSTSFITPANGTGPISTTARYFDDGSVQQTTDGRGARMTTSRPIGDFAECAARPTRTVTVTNEHGHAVTTLSDCWTGSPTTVTDANGQVGRTAYDRLGRVVSVTGPGDATPTRWFDYFLLGSRENTGGATVSSLAAQRTVVHDKDGSADGRYVKTFMDGLGRAVQTRAEVDPLTANGFREVVTTTEYDDMGRVSRQQVPCFAAASDTKADCPGAQAVATAYDVLGRAVRITRPGNLVTSTTYGGNGLDWIVTTTPPNGAGHESRATLNVLGQMVETARKWSGCAGCWLATTLTHDAAGRLLTMRDPAANETTWTYDGLGRRLTMRDPDMGGFANRSWSYAYDNSGNLISQTDAKGQTIGMQYDALNRLTLKDLPPAGPGEEDVTYHYDGVLPATCHSCDDRDPSTTDTCNVATLTCSHSGCSRSIAPTSASAASSGSSGSVAVTAGCAWTAVSNAPWLTVTGGASGSGNGTVTWSAAANTSTASRSGTITIAGQTFTVTQSGPSCSYAISPTSRSFTAAGGSGSVSVAAGTGCAWTAVSNASWITVTGGASGSGNGTVTYSVAANPGTLSRTGTLTIAGQTHTVTQSGTTPCSFSINPTSNQHGAAGGGGNVNVTAGTGCAWTATPNVSWLRITSGGSGSGNGTANYAVDPNTAAAPRTGTITIAGQTFTVNQAGVTGNRSVYLVSTLNRYVNVPDSPSLDVTGPFTVEAWVSTFTPPPAQMGIVERYNWLGSEDGGFAFRLTNSRLELWVIRAAGATAMVQGGTSIQPGWHHVAGVYDGSQLRVYLDGRLDGTATSALAPAAGTASLKIGARGDDGSFTWDGFIDEVRLTPSVLYSANFAPSPHLTAVSGTRGLWKFDDQAASDSSGNGNHGTFVNGAAPGGPDDYPEHGALGLNGVNAYVQVPSSGSLGMAGSVTLEAWIKPMTATANQRIVQREKYSLKLITSANGLKVKLSLDGATTTEHVTSVNAVSTGVWHHVVGVFDGASSQLRVYIDGALDNTKAWTEGVAAGTGALRIGRALDNTEPFNGVIDEVRVTSRAVYSGSSFVPEKRLPVVQGTRGLWRFDRHFAQDVSGNGNHGGFFNGAAIVSDVPQ